MSVIHPSHCVFAGSFLVAFVFACISLLTPYWIVVKDLYGNTLYNFGLFKVCSQGSCHDYKDPNALDLDVVAGLIISGIVVYVLCMFIFGYMLATRKNIASTNTGKLNLVVCVLGAVLIWCGVGHFVQKTMFLTVGYSWKSGYSCNLAWTSGAAGVVAGVAAFVSARVLFNKRFPQELEGARVQPSGNCNPATVVITNTPQAQPNPNANHPMQLQAPDIACYPYPGPGMPMK